MNRDNIPAPTTPAPSPAEALDAKVIAGFTAYTDLFRKVLADPETEARYNNAEPTVKEMTANPMRYLEAHNLHLLLDVAKIVMVAQSTVKMMYPSAHSDAELGGIALGCLTASRDYPDSTIHLRVAAIVASKLFQDLPTRDAFITAAVGLNHYRKELK